MASPLFSKQAVALSCESQAGQVSLVSSRSRSKLLRTETSRADFSPSSSYMMNVPKCLGLSSLLSLREVRGTMLSTRCTARASVSSRRTMHNSRFSGADESTRRFQLSARRKGEMAGVKRMMLVVMGSAQHDGTRPLDRSDLEDILHLNDEVGSEALHRIKGGGIPSDRSELEEMLHLNDDLSSESVRHHENHGTPLPLAAAGSSPPYLQARNKTVRNGYKIEEGIERTIFNFRFLTLFAVVGSLLGAVLCFVKGCAFVWYSYREYYRAFFGVGHTSRVILYLVEAVDVYLMGTVMLIFGMGLYELFVSSLDVGGIPGFRNSPDGVVRSTVPGSSLFGIFRLTERPKWLEIRSLDELKTKLGHVIVMILFVGLFEKSKRVVVHTATDFLCFSGSILLSAGALFLLSMLHHGRGSTHSN